MTVKINDKVIIPNTEGKLSVVPLQLAATGEGTTLLNTGDKKGVAIQTSPVTVGGNVIVVRDSSGKNIAVQGVNAPGETKPIVQFGVDQVQSMSCALYYLDKRYIRIAWNPGANNKWVFIAISTIRFPQTMFDGIIEWSAFTPASEGELLKRTLRYGQWQFITIWGVVEKNGEYLFSLYHLHCQVFAPVQGGNIDHYFKCYTTREVNDFVAVAEQWSELDFEGVFQIYKGNVSYSGIPVFVGGSPEGGKIPDVGEYDWFEPYRGLWVGRYGSGQAPPNYMVIDDGLEIKTDKGIISNYGWGYYAPIDITSLLNYGNNQVTITLLTDWGIDGFSDICIWNDPREQGGASFWIYGDGVLPPGGTYGSGVKRAYSPSDGGLTGYTCTFIFSTGLGYSSHIGYRLIDPDNGVFEIQAWINSNGSYTELYFGDIQLCTGGMGITGSYHGFLGLGNVEL